MSEELKVTKERVLAAAKTCDTARRVLKELFPEAFALSGVNLLALAAPRQSDPMTVFTDAQCNSAGLPAGCVRIRDGGTFTHKAFYLAECGVSWELKRDEHRALVLIPTLART